MDVRQLRYFVAIVECGSISRAAQRLNVAQPSLSLHVRNMEADLGVALLHRHPHGVQPTEAGQVLLRKAREIVAHFEEAEREIRSGDNEPSGEVAIGLPSSIAQVLSVPLVLAAQAELPRVRLRIAEAMSGYVLDWLRQGTVDLGLLYRPVEDREVRSTGLLTETLMLFTASGERDATALGPGSVTLSQLAGLPMILPGPGHGLRELVDHQALSAGIRIQPHIEIDAYGAIRSLVAGGLGFSILPDHAIAEEVAAGRLLAWAFDPGFERTVHLAWPADRTPSRATQAVELLCQRTLARLVRCGAWGQARIQSPTPT